MTNRRTRAAADPGGSSKESTFEFVSVVPTKDGRAKPTRQAVVRKNAARYQWRKNNSTKSPAKKSVKSSPTRPDDAGVELEETGSVRRRQENQVTGPVYRLHRSGPVLQMYNMSFGNNKKVAEIMTFAQRAILPSLIPSSRPNVDHPGNKVLAQMIISDPLVFQIWEYHVELHYRLKFGRQLDPENDFLAMEGKIIKSLNERMNHTARAPSNANILCVLGMTNTQIPGTLMSKPLDRLKWPSQGPLTSLNALDTLGRLPSVTEHVKGLELLVNLRGGFLTVKSPIGSMISIIDIIDATRNLRPPRFPHAPFNELPALYEIPEAKELPDSMPTIGYGFPEQWRQSNFQPLQDLFSTLQYLAGYSVLVYNHTQGIAMQTHGLLTDQRNSVQHRLLSLPAHPYEQSGRDIPKFYEITRLAAQMYSLLCVYPYPAGPAPFAELAIRLRIELSNLDPCSLNSEESKLYLWILVMGAIMTVGTFNRLWFIAAISPVARRLRLASWQDMKALLVTFLWIDMTNDIDGREVWDEINQPYRSYTYSWSQGSPAALSPVSSLDLTVRTRSSASVEVEERELPHPHSASPV